MAVLLAFGLTLVAAVLVSERAHRTVLSTAVMFLAAGFLLGEGVLDVIVFTGDDDRVLHVAELALFSVLFTDGMRTGAPDLVGAWRLPGRALLLGMPLTLVAIAVLAWLLTDLAWAAAFLIGAVLSPTDPVFASAIVGREEVPGRLRRLLNVESGLNDGLALPVVVTLIAVLGPRDVSAATLAEELALGVGIGVVVPWVALRLERSRVLAASTYHQPLYVVAIGLVVLALAEVTHGNLFLAAFAAGVTVETVAPENREAFGRFGELVAELIKLAALLLFGALISPSFLAEVPVTGYAFAVLVIAAARPATLSIALIGSGLNRREWLTAAWFGPKGFASVVYGILVAESGIAPADQIFHLVAITVALSILAHSSTDVLVARWFREEERDADVERAGAP